MRPVRSVPLLLICVLLICAVPVLAQITLNSFPSRAIGQNSLQASSLAPNLVEGREFLSPQALALDTSVNPPALYVSDTGNNRVLGFRNATGFSNGQKADIVLGQLDFATTVPQGPARTTRTTGLAAPGGIAVDQQGNLYVADTANNRILRFPQPFTQTGDQLPDLVLGQTTFASNAPNNGGVSAYTLSFTSSAGQATTLAAFIAFDSAGNLWVADSGNNRILRYNAAVLGPSAPSGPAADLVLGQSDFETGTYSPPGFGSPVTSLSAITTPTGIAFDSKGRLFVAESLSSQRGRILMWSPPFVTGRAATRLLAVDTDSPQPPATSEFQVGTSPGNLFAVNDSIGIADTFNNRLLVFPPVEQWTPGATYQAATGVVGQADFNSGSPNRGLFAAGPDRLARPGGAAFLGGELYVVDSLNHRLIVMPRSAAASGFGTPFGPATRVLGQDRLDTNSPNLIEGREFNFTASGGDAGLAVDLTSNPPHLYVADTFNNRILGFNDLRNIKPGAKADIVIGQPDFQHAGANYPSGDATKPNASGLSTPTGLVVDSNGNLYVADTSNGRVLRFPKPFANYVPGTPEQADLVIGQLNFFTKITDPSTRTMSSPYGLALVSQKGLLVSDINHNRVLLFPGRSSELRSGMSASLVFGQPDFNSTAAGAETNQLNSPHHISTDSDDRLYVADTGNGRVSIFDHAPTANPNPFAAQTLTSRLSSPRGMYVSNDTGDIWVCDSASNQAVRYPPYNDLFASGFAANAVLTNVLSPRAVVEDQWGNLFMADAANRVTVYYPAMSAINAANYLAANVVAPGMITALYTKGNFNQFGGAPVSATALPLPRQLNGLQVLFNGAPVPLFYADPSQINFQVPMGAPQSGFADLQVVEIETGRVLGETALQMNNVLPGLFTQAGNGSGAAAALNQDNTVNSQTNPAVQGSIITLFGTGQGFIPGAPDDGDVSGKPLQTERAPTVIMGTGPIPDANIKYAGLAPTLVGVWQLNLLIPDTVITLPNNPTQVIVLQNSVPSGGGGFGRAVIIYVKAK